MRTDNVGYTRAGRLDNFCSRFGLPTGLSWKDLALENMVPAEADDKDLRTVLFRPLDDPKHAKWFLLAGIHNTHEDRNTYVVAGRLMDREAAEVLLRDPALLLAVGNRLLEETPAQVADYPNHQPTLPDWLRMEPYNNASVTAPLQPLTQGGRLLLCGAVKALLSGNRELGFVHADRADLQAVLQRLPLELALQLSFCLSFNLAGGCCTQLNLVDEAQVLDIKPRNGWPSDLRYLMTEDELAKQSSNPRFRLLYRALEELDGRRWDRELGSRTAEQTIQQLCAVGALLEQAGNAAQAEKSLMRISKLRRSTVKQLVAEGAQWLSLPQSPKPSRKLPLLSAVTATAARFSMLHLLPAVLLCLAGGAALLHIAIPDRFLISMTLELHTDLPTAAGLAALLAGTFLLGRQSKRPHR